MYISGNYRRPNFQCTLKVRNLEKKWRRGGGLHVHHVEQKRINKLICATLLWWCRVPTNDEFCHSEPVELGVQGGIWTPNICQIQSPYFIRRGQILPFYNYLQLMMSSVTQSRWNWGCRGGGICTLIIFVRYNHRLFHLEVADYAILQGLSSGFNILWRPQRPTKNKMKVSVYSWGLGIWVLSISFF